MVVRYLRASVCPAYILQNVVLRTVCRLGAQHKPERKSKLFRLRQQDFQCPQRLAQSGSSLVAGLYTVDGQRPKILAVRVELRPCHIPCDGLLDLAAGAGHFAQVSGCD